MLMIALSKMEAGAICQELNLLQLFVRNYKDNDFDVLDLILKKLNTSQRLSVPRQPTSHIESACDIAFETGKFNLFVRLLNAGHRLSDSLQIGNMGTVSIASEYGIKIDLSDVANHYDCSKVNEAGKTVFHLMALAKDARLLPFVSSLG